MGLLRFGEWQVPAAAKKCFQYAEIGHGESKFRLLLVMNGVQAWSWTPLALWINRLRDRWGAGGD
jgi:hypothetical protein